MLYEELIAILERVYRGVRSLHARGIPTDEMTIHMSTDIVDALLREVSGPLGRAIEPPRDAGSPNTAFGIDLIREDDWEPNRIELRFQVVC